MPIRPSIDDTNTTLIEYQGDWQAMLGGSSRQWESSVHATIQPGASATFRFIGYQVWMWGTNPAGTGSNLLDIAIDGGAATSISQTSNGSAVYNVLYYTSAIMTDSLHQITVTNRGSIENGHTEFLLDRFEFETAANFVVYPTTSSLSTSATSISPSPSSSLTSSSPSQHTSKSHTGAIAGSIIGVLALLAIALAYILWRRRKRSRSATEGSSGERRLSYVVPPNRSGLTAPIPFQLRDGASSQIDSNLDPRTRLLEKAACHIQQEPAATTEAPVEANVVLNDHVPRTMPSSTSLATATGTSSDIYASPRPTVQTIVLGEETIPHAPPPSYSQTTESSVGSGNTPSGAGS